MTILSAAKLGELQAISNQMRLDAVTMVHRSKSAHLGSSLSMIDVLAVLYCHYLKLDPKNPKWSERDRFILSKGHGGSGLYAALAARGFFDRSTLEEYGRDGGRLAVHPSAMLVPGVEASTGSLGHGLPVGVGMALAGKRDGKEYKTVVVVSDGECDEGSTWEAILAAGNWKLSNLICIVDYNKIQSFGRVDEVMPLEPFADKWKAFGWGVEEVDGHDHEAIAACLARVPFVTDRPSAIIAHTVKGKGAKWMEDTVASHYQSPTDAHLAQAVKDFSCSPDA